MPCWRRRRRGIRARQDGVFCRRACEASAETGPSCIEPIEPAPEAKCYGTFLVRCSGDVPAYVDGASLGMACGYVEDRVDCFEVVVSE